MRYLLAGLLLELVIIVGGLTLMRAATSLPAVVALFVVVVLGGAGAVCLGAFAEVTHTDHEGRDRDRDRDENGNGNGGE